MAATPFAFLRGSAGLMAHDLVGTPVTGVGAQICGDAHAANFGLYGDARGRLVIDLNDFDETVVGPWEWDLKRLAVSLVLAGRVAGADENRLPGGRVRRRGRVPAHHAAAGEDACAGRMERHRRRGTRLPRGRARSARHAGAGRRRRPVTTRVRDSPPRRRRRCPTAAKRDGASWTRRRCCGGCRTRRRRPSPRRSRSICARCPRTGCRCSRGTRSTMWRSGWSAPGASAPGRMWCCCSTTGAIRWCCR